MKCKRIFKVAGALALTVALLVSSAVVSFAATYTTTTTYLNQNTIEVTSVASGLSKGEMATYVAYNNDGFDEANAVYIDQATANGTDPVKFIYQTDSDNVKATVKFGGSAEEQGPVEPNKDWWKINVQIGEGAPSTVEVPKAADNYDGEYLAREIPVALEAGSTVADVKVNGAAVEAWYVKNGAVVIYSNVITDGATVVIGTKPAENVDLILSEVKSGEPNTVTAFAKATCGAYADYGILIKADENVVLDGAKEYNVAEDYNTTVKLPALGMSNEGVFCVEVVDSVFNGGTFYVAAYAGKEVTDPQAVQVSQAVAE